MHPLCIEILTCQSKRKNYSKINNESMYQTHAAQIYAEMLDQVCHGEAYKDPQMFQEVRALSPMTTKLTSTRHLFFTHDMWPSTFFMQRFRIPISETLPCTVLNISNESPILKGLQFTSPACSACDFHDGKLNFSVFCLRSCITSLTGIVLFFYISKHENNRLYRKITGLDILSTPSSSPNKQELTHTLFFVHN